MKSKALELLTSAAMFSAGIGSFNSNIPSRAGNEPPNGNSRRTHKENVARKKKRTLIKKARSIQRSK